MLTKFVGFKGKCAFAQVDKISFVILAQNERQLSILWAHIMESVPLDPSGIKSAILIEANALPGKRAVTLKPVSEHEQNQT
jgi:hypothetical protein